MKKPPAIDRRQRCSWARLTNPLYLEYHDTEWGVPQHDDRHLFEMLILEGAQAGLSWETVLNKRARYRQVFAGFDPKRVARFDRAKVRELMADPGIIRNQLKIDSAIDNAKAFLAVQAEFGSFDSYLWGFVNGRPLVNTTGKVPASTSLSDAISRDLKKRGFRFVGSTIIYAYMQAVGVVNDHLSACFRYRQVGAAPGRRAPAKAARARATTRPARPAARRVRGATAPRRRRSTA
jgi:DNA-3-methyladenine glycosylase I